MSNYPEKAKMHKCRFVVKMAGLTYEVNSIYASSQLLCKDYITSEKPDITVHIEENDIIQEIEKGEIFYYSCIEYSDSSESKRVIAREINRNNIESVILYRKIIEASLDYGVFFMHGAVVVVNDSAYMFTAPSGTGKTTHILKWLDKLKDAYVLNGDKPLLKITESKVIACGTPWQGNENMGTNAMVPLKAIVLMERSDRNTIEEISFVQAYPFLLQQVYLPDDAEKARKELALLLQLNGKVKFFKFRFNNFLDDCFQTSYDALVKKCDNFGKTDR